MIVDTQNIPAGLLELYKEILEPASPEKVLESIRKRYPWRLPHMQGDGLVELDPWAGKGVTAAQFEIRKQFKRACEMFNLQPYSGGVTPPALGYRNRSWFYDDGIGSGLYYFTYYMKLSLIALLGGTIPDWFKQTTAYVSRVRFSHPDEVFKDSFFIRAWNRFAGFIDYTFVKTDWPAGYVWLMLYTYTRDTGPDEMTVGFYEVSTPWSQETITWDNMPAAGSKFYELTVTSHDQVWYPIPIENIYSFVVKSEIADGDITFRGGYQYPEVQHFYYPYGD